LFDLLEKEVYAWEILRDPETGGSLSAEGVLEMYRAAGYSEEIAQKAASERAWQRMQRDMPV
jgi:hypothetical protein